MLFFTHQEEIIETAEVATRQNDPIKLILFCMLIILLIIYCFIYDYRSNVKKGKAYAKVNLFLNILNKRKDGYHNLKSIFDFVSLYDVITIKKTNTFKLICNDKSLENNDNIIYKAYLLLKERYPFIKGVKVVLSKHIPMQAGLGGGSSDCAKFIELMVNLYDLDMSYLDIKELSLKLGADVLPCYHQNALLASGIGEEIELIENNLKYYLVIVKPPFDCSTKEMYQKLDKKKRVEKRNINKVVKALKDNNVEELAKNLYNDFEKVVDIKDIKKDFEQSGALNSLLSGSGSCIFGVFATYEDALKGYNILKEKYECFICQNVH